MMVVVMVDREIPFLYNSTPTQQEVTVARDSRARCSPSILRVLYHRGTTVGVTSPRFQSYIAPERRSPSLLK